MRRIFKIIVCLFMLLFSISAEARYGVDAISIYKQARLKNYNFLEYVSDYGNLIDKTNRFGDSALCIAIKYRDKDTARLLIKYGANKNHQCIKKMQTKNNRVQSVAKSNVVLTQKSAPSYISSDSNNYLLWGGIGAAVIGGAALASGGGGGGSSHYKANTPTDPDKPNDGDDNGGDDTGGDDTGGDDTGGDDTGGDDNGGDDNGGDDTGGDDTGGDDNGGDDTGGDDNGGDDNGGDDTGGDDTGGDDNGGDDTGGDDGVKLYDVKASEFKTSEYTKGNFLSFINAAEAYAHIYKKDENGKLISHQAGSDKPLEKVKVGIIDVGV